MNAPPLPVAVGIGALAVGGVVDLVGGDPSTMIAVAFFGVLATGWKIAGALQGGVSHRHALDAESAKAIGAAMGTAIGDALARQRQDGRELAAATDRLRRAVRALPGNMQAKVAENHHDLVQAMDDTREALGPWQDSPQPGR